MKSSENDSIDRRSLLRGSVVGMTGLIAAKQSELTADDTKKATAADDAKKSGVARQAT